MERFKEHNPDEPTGRANARPMTGSATSGIFKFSTPHVTSFMRATRYQIVL